MGLGGVEMTTDPEAGSTTGPEAGAGRGAQAAPAPPIGWPAPRRLPRTRYVHASPQTWSLIRGAYLSGLSAPTVAARFGVSETAIRKRARREGWTKREYAALTSPWAGPGFGMPGAPDAPAASAVSAPTAPSGVLTEDGLLALYQSEARLEPADLARSALNRAAVAVRAGRGLEAVRLARAATEIARLDGLLEFGVDIEASDQEWEGRQAMFRLFVRETALDLARRLAAGEPLPPEYQEVEAVQARNAEIRAADEAARSESEA